MATNKGPFSSARHLPRFPMRYLSYLRADKPPIPAKRCASLRPHHILTSPSTALRSFRPMHLAYALPPPTVALSRLIPSRCSRNSPSHPIPNPILLPRRSDYLSLHPDPPHLHEPSLIILIGVSHSPTPTNPSASLVSQVINQYQPDAVVVELCRARATMLHPPTPVQSRIASIANTLNLPLGGLLSARSGAEFRAAREAAEKVGATLVLGDRPVGLTMRKAWESLSMRERGMLVLGLFRGWITGGEGDAELMRLVERGEGGNDVVDRYLTLMRESFPGLFQAVVEERDMYLAWSLKRSRAVRGKKCVVGVVGRAHMGGVVEWLKRDDEARRKGDRLLWFRKLVG